MAFDFAGLFFAPLLRRRESGSVQAIADADVYVYLEDGETLATLYTARDKETEADNPLAPTSNGNLEFFADPGIYTVEVLIDGVSAFTDLVVVPLDPDNARGEAGTITVGTVEASEPGGDPAVENVGTASEAELNFTFPRGATGDQGATGPAWDGWQGAWVDGDYDANDVVSHEGESWIAPAGAATGQEPGVHAAWEKLAAKGADGAGSVNSVNGDTGPDVVLDHTDVGADEAGTAASAVTAHEGAADPHSGYLTEAEGDAAYEALVDRTGASEGDVPKLQGDGTLAFDSGSSVAWFDVTRYGATGDGVTDDTAAIQSAADAANAAGGGILYLPAGTYLVSDISATPNQIAVAIGTNIRVLGAGVDQTTVKLATNGDGSVFRATNQVGVTFESLTIDGNAANQTAAAISGNALCGIEINRSSNVRIKDVAIRDTAYYGIGLHGSDPLTDIRIRDVHIAAPGADGIDIKNQSDANENITIESVTVVNPGVGFADQAGIDIRGPVMLSNITVEDVGAGHHGIRFRYGTAAEPNGVGADGSRLTNFYVTLAGGTDVTVETGVKNVTITRQTPALHGMVGALAGTDLAGDVTARPMLMQAGSYSATTDASGELTIPFPKVFPTGVVTVVASLGFLADRVVVVGDPATVTTTSFKVRVYKLDGTVSASSAQRINYWALGY